MIYCSVKIYMLPPGLKSFLGPALLTACKSGSIVHCSFCSMSSGNCIRLSTSANLYATLAPAVSLRSAFSSTVAVYSSSGCVMRWVFAPSPYALRFRTMRARRPSVVMSTPKKFCTSRMNSLTVQWGNMCAMCTVFLQFATMIRSCHVLLMALSSGLMLKPSALSSRSTTTTRKGCGAKAVSLCMCSCWLAST